MAKLTDLHVTLVHEVKWKLCQQLWKHTLISQLKL